MITVAFLFLHVCFYRFYSILSYFPAATSYEIELSLFIDPMWNELQEAASVVSVSFLDCNFSETT